MSDETCEVVLVKGWDGNEGPVRINKSDYDANPDQYTLYEAEAPAEATAPAGAPPAAPVGAPPAGAPPQKPKYLVLKEGTKFFVSDDQGVKQAGEGIDEGGYSTKSAAEAAIAKL